MTDTSDNHSSAGAKQSAVRRYHAVYDPSELARAIKQIKGGVTANTFAQSPDDSVRDWVEAEPTTLTSEDVNRLRHLERIAADPRGHRRRSIIGSADMVRAVECLSAGMPHFAPATNLVARAALVSARTATPLRLPPILLLGEPGIGKSYILRRLAEAIGADFALIAANIVDGFRLRGLNTAWRGARLGRIAEVLLGSSTAPVVLVDEFDKAVGDRVERPYDIWHSLLERENSVVFKDDFLEIELRADHITWFASANDVSAIPTSILDRLLVLEIPNPSRDQLRVIVASIYASCREAYGGSLPERMTDKLLEALICHNPRRIGRLLDLAVGYAASGGRRSICVDDIRSAGRLVGDAPTNRKGFQGQVGFTQGLSGDDQI